ncbi:hypothetical protein E4U43_001977, partial [Claviceps pusilla]
AASSPAQDPTTRPRRTRPSSTPERPHPMDWDGPWPMVGTRSWMCLASWLCRGRCCRRSASEVDLFLRHITLSRRYIFSFPFFIS